MQNMEQGVSNLPPRATSMVAQDTLRLVKLLAATKTENHADVTSLHTLEGNILSQILQDIMVENVRLREQNAILKAENADLSNQIRHDPKTGLWNKKGLEEKAIECLSSRNVIRRDSDPKNMPQKQNFLIFIDLCEFKKINDTYGHEAGDEAIQLTARILKNNWRSADIITRTGGDEFCILAKSINQDTLNQKIENLRRAFDGNPLFIDTLKGIPVLLTIKPAIGYAHGSDENLTFCEWLKKADTAMYQDKDRLKKRTKKPRLWYFKALVYKIILT